MADSQLPVFILLYLIAVEASKADSNGTLPINNSVTNSSEDIGISTTRTAIMTSAYITNKSSHDDIGTGRTEQVTMPSQSPSYRDTRETHGHVTDWSKSPTRNRTDLTSSNVTSVMTTASSTSTSDVTTERTSAETSQSYEKDSTTSATKNVTSLATLGQGKGFFMLCAGVIITLAVVVAAVLYNACRRNGYRKHMGELLNIALTEPSATNGSGSGDHQENGLDLSATVGSRSKIEQEPIYAKPVLKYKRVHYDLEDQV